MVQETVELNITAFLNLMVILVPFLLITAVFSRITILELNLPGKNAKADGAEQITLQLELIIKPNSFEFRDATLGRIRYLSRAQDDTDWKAFDRILIELKKRFPEHKRVTLLLDRQVSYKTLIQVMDRVRSVDVVNINAVETKELFPEISIGDAPESATDADSRPAGEG